MKNIGRITKNTLKSLFLTLLSVLMIESVVYLAYTTSVAGNLTKGQFIKTNILVFIGCFVLYVGTVIKACAWDSHGGINVLISGIIIGFIFLPVAHQIALFRTYYEWIFPTPGAEWANTHVMHDPELFNKTLWSAFLIPYGFQLLISALLSTFVLTNDHKSEPNM